MTFTDVSQKRQDLSLSLVVGNIYSIQQAQARISKEGKLIQKVTMGTSKIDDSLE